MGLDDIPVRDPQTRSLLERDLQALRQANAPGFRTERTRFRLEVALRNGLGQREAERLGQLAEPQSLSPVWQQQLRRIWASTGARWAFAAAATAVTSVAVWLAVPMDTAVQDSTEQWVAEQDPHRHQLDDGSSIVLQPGGKGQLARSGQTMHFALEQGAALFDIVPNPELQWRITAQDYEVTVEGTRLRVRYEPKEEFEVEVFSGVVDVRVPEQEIPLRLSVGDQLLATPQEVTLRHGFSIAMGQLAEGMKASPADHAEPSLGTAAALEGDSGNQNADVANVQQPVARVQRAREAARRTEVRPSDTRSEPTELQLLSRARKAIAAGKHADAMRWVRAHRQRYPDGQLAEEREALRVEALRGTGREAEARRAAGEFKQRFPKSVLAPQMPTAEK